MWVGAGRVTAGSTTATVTFPAGAIHSRSSRKVRGVRPRPEPMARRSHSHRSLGSGQVIGHRREGESVPKALRFIR